jgi:hypothetical protein
MMVFLFLMVMVLLMVFSVVYVMLMVLLNVTGMMVDKVYFPQHLMHKI